MLYRKLNRVWSHSWMNPIPGFFETFPELKYLSSEELADRFANLGIDFYTNDEDSVTPLIRLTLPIAFVVILIMFLFLPVNFILSGRWGYNFSKKNVIRNWFEMLF